MRIVSLLYDDFAHWDKGVVIGRARELSKEDILILHGGSDISPAYYGEKPNSKVHVRGPSERDRIEYPVISRAIDLEIPIFGICRGAQWLSILAGGKLVQHVDGHGYGTHPIKLLDSGKTIESNTCHHQQMFFPNVKDAVVLAEHENVSVRLGEYDSPIPSSHNDPEIVWFPSVRGFAVQGHPEWMSPNSDFVKYCLTKAKELFNVASK